MHARLSALILALAALLACAPAARAVDDGLARTPPMGFNNWNTTGCGGDFDADLVESTARFLERSGLKAAGYDYVNLDDCWAQGDRDAGDRLVPDRTRFPHGIKALADYVHARGLKLGLYTSAGTKTCNAKGFPGGLGHEASDARQFAAWGVDYLKYDNCHNQGVAAVQRYTAMRNALAATGRKIVLSICEWGQSSPWTWAGNVAHLWRTTGDIRDRYSSLLAIVHRNLGLWRYAGPGHWNDPDMLEVGNGGMSTTEYRSQFSLWAVMAAPLLIGSDLRTASRTTLDILRNRDVIAVDQDPLGRQGVPVQTGGHDVIVKPLAGGARAIALFNETGRSARISTSAAQAGFASAPRYHVRDLWTGRAWETAGGLSATVAAHGTVLLRVSR
jgi:alpha-galactosidase